MGPGGGRGCMEAGQEVIWGSDPQMEIKHRSSFIDPNAGKLNRSSKPTKHHNELTFFQLKPWSSLGEALKHLVRVQKRSWLGLKYLKTQLKTSWRPVKDIWLLYYKHGWKRPDFWSEIFRFFCQRYLVFGRHKPRREMSWFLVSTVPTSRQNITFFVVSNTARDVRKFLWNHPVLVATNVSESVLTSHRQYLFTAATFKISRQTRLYVPL